MLPFLAVLLMIWLVGAIVTFFCNMEILFHDQKKLGENWIWGAILHSIIMAVIWPRIVIDALKNF